MSKRQELREKRRSQERLQRILIILGMAVIAVAIVGWVILSQKAPEGIVQITPVARPQANANAAGDPNAPVKIIQYADFQCPHCKTFADGAEAQIMETYVKTGKVYFEYHSVGGFLGPESARTAEAAYCAGDQQKFWEMHDTIYANQGRGAHNSGAFDNAHLTIFARDIGLDMPQFNDCFGGGKYKGKVSQDQLDATQAGIQSTPSFLINGKLIAGAQPFSVFQQEIEAALAAATD